MAIKLPPVTWNRFNPDQFSPDQLGLLAMLLAMLAWALAANAERLPLLPHWSLLLQVEWHEFGLVKP